MFFFRFVFYSKFYSFCLSIYGHLCTDLTIIICIDFFRAQYCQIRQKNKFYSFQNFKKKGKEKGRCMQGMRGGKLFFHFKFS